MTDQINPAPGNAPEQVPPARKRGRRWFLLTVGGLAAALTGAVASQALSQGGPPWHRGGMMGGPFHMGASVDPARAEDHADRMIRHLAIEIDATAEQQDKLRAIARATVKDLVPLHEKAHGARERARALLTSPTVDRTAIETFRTEHLALADEASRRVARALGDAAEVLTPVQRRKVDDLLEWRRSHWRRWHRG
jgi:Spy/CpxP family protein refolding chaperone